ncbi:MAG TPA: hypothetical protein VFI95_04650 [Terriglobales bacterium]|nr:hypothetical protein [Terriglobales bacterium]
MSLEEFSSHFQKFTCPECGHSSAFYSRRKNFVEKVILRALFLRPYRCVSCFCRCYRLASVPGIQPRVRQGISVLPTSVTTHRVA